MTDIALFEAPSGQIDVRLGKDSVPHRQEPPVRRHGNKRIGAFLFAGLPDGAPGLY